MQVESDDPENGINHSTIRSVKEEKSVKWAQNLCFMLIVIMNLSAWIDLQGLYVEIPIIVPYTPERWTLPSIAGICMCAANIVPVLVVLIRWRQGKRFSEIPYIYLIIIVGVVACFILALFWQKTVFVFGRERSVWLLGCIFILSMLDCTSSLVFFDYMKRFRARYLKAAFWGEALTSAIPTLLIIAQGVAGETICIRNKVSNILEPSYTQPRFSVRVFMFCITGIIVASLIAFILLRWTNIVTLANAAETVIHEKVPSSENTVVEEALPMVTDVKSLKPTPMMTRQVFLFLLILNTINGTIGFGCLPSLSTYALLPFGQKAFYYWSVLMPIAYPIGLVLHAYLKTASNRTIVVLSMINWVLSAFVIVIAKQSPCPWLADSIQGATMMISVWFIISVIGAFLRMSVGSRIKKEWPDDKGMFYYGGSDQLGLFLGTIPTYMAISVFDLFTDREPCRTYCVS